ncbi:MAG: Mce-associated rane protein [Frankiaceae bacterium]|jgi:Mce-associated membrane protein|nr:Mce-associated rane protein [Frankiaceae bacterium]
MQSNAGRGVSVAAAVGCLVVGVAGSALAAFGARQVSRSADVSAIREQALGAARQIAVDFAAYDYHHLARDFQRVADESTGAFRKDYLTQSAGVQDLIQKAKSVSIAQVAGAGVVEADAARATVVLAVNRTVKNTSVPNGQTDSFGLQITLLHLHGQWLASDVKPL